MVSAGLYRDNTRKRTAFFLIAIIIAALSVHLRAVPPEAISKLLCRRKPIYRDRLRLGWLLGRMQLSSPRTDANLGGGIVYTCLRKILSYAIQAYHCHQWRNFGGKGSSMFGHLLHRLNKKYPGISNCNVLLFDFLIEKKN